MPIKPEDVTDQHIKQIKDYLEGQIGWPLMPDNAQLSALANALIQAGIVSPPVWVIKEDGVIISGCFSSHKKAVAYRDSLWQSEKYTVEHWNGKASNE